MKRSVDTGCYHVYRSNEGWEVAFDHDVPLRVFDSEEAALDAARVAAEAHWMMTRKPTCVGRGRPGTEMLIDRDYG